MSKKLIYLISFALVLCLFQTSIANAADPYLVGWWKFDEGSGTTAIDSSGNGFDIPLHNTTLEDGVFGGALHFHGVGYGYVENFNYSDNAITVCAWVQHDAFRTGEIERYVTVAPEIAVIRKDWDRSLHFYIKTDGNLRHLWGSDVLREGRWYHVAGTWDGVTQRLYIDGVEIASQVPGGVLDNTSNVEMSSDGELFNGMLDDVRIYNRALTQNGIQVIMQGEEFSYAFSPTPPDGAVLADTNVTLSWESGFGVKSHTVYFGDNFDDVNDGAEGTFRGNQAETFFIAGFPGFPYPDGLVPGTIYYWRIDEVNDTEPNSPWKGNVWSFLILPNAAYAPGQFAITYYDNYNYDTGQWDAWQSAATPQDAWDDKYLADGSSGNTVYTDHAFTSITAFDLRGGLFSKDGHASGGEDWNPLQSIGDNVSGQSAHHVFAALFKGLIYLEEGDNLMVASDDDVYVFLDGDTAWGQEVLSIPFASHFDTDSMTVTAAQAGYHTITVKYIERINDHSGIEITLNGGHLQNAEVVRVVTVPGPACIFFAGQDQAILESDYPPDPVGPGDHDNFHNDTALIANSIPPSIEVYSGGKLSISAAGVWNRYADIYSGTGPDGFGFYDDTHDEYVNLGGISRVIAPLNTLVGVFLTNDPPDPRAKPISLTLGDDMTTPEIQQAFAIGSSLENIAVPEGATRLFFGLNDGGEWNNNVGSVEVTCEGDVRSRSEVASYPYPADGATHTDSWITLSWSPGMSAISHDVYFGDDRDNVDTGTSGTFKGNQTETWFNVGSVRSPYLVPGTTYYWRIDEVNADGTTYKGDIWSFSRGS